MALYSEIDLLIPPMEAVPGVARVTEGWPDDLSVLPCIAIEEAANTPAQFGDDAAYAAHLEYYIRVFGYDAGINRRISSAIDDLMAHNGYTRQLKFDSSDEEIRYCALRYQKLI